MNARNANAKNAIAVGTKKIAFELKKGLNDVVVKTKNVVLRPTKTKKIMIFIWKSFAFKVKKIKGIMNF